MRWPSAFTVLQFRDFRLIWAGQFVAMLGMQIQTVALGWLVYDLTGSPAQLGLVGLFRALPIILLSLFGGTLADQSDRRSLLMVTQSSQVVLSLTLAILVTTGLTVVWVLFAFAFLTASASSFDAPSRQAIIPSLVPRERLGNALTLNVLSGNTGMVLGPTLSGLIIGQFGNAAAFWAGAASFFAVISALILMRMRPPVPRPPRRGLAALVDGLRFVLDRRILWQLMLIDFMATLAVSPIGLLPVFARDIHRVGPEGLGLLYAAPSIGAVIGSLVFASLPSPRYPGRMVALAISGYGAALALFGLAPSFQLALGLLALAGGLDAVSMAMRHTVRQLATPDDYRGRIGALSSVFSAGGPRLGEFQAGVMASLLGARGAMLIGGLACVGLALASNRWARGLWRYTVDEGEGGGGGPADHDPASRRVAARSASPTSGEG
jgi:MFS family permease